MKKGVRDDSYNDISSEPSPMHKTTSDDMNFGVDIVLQRRRLGLQCPEINVCLGKKYDANRQIQNVLIPLSSQSEVENFLESYTFTMGPKPATRKTSVFPDFVFGESIMISHIRYEIIHHLKNIFDQMYCSMQLYVPQLESILYYSFRLHLKFEYLS